jgi:hypothetical protein
MRLGIAEIDQHPVAHVFGDKAGEPRHRRGDAAVVSADDLAQILGIELLRQRCRTDQVAKHDRQLPALGRPRRRFGRRDGAPRFYFGNRSEGEFGDGVADAQPMAGARDANVLQQLIVDLAEQLRVDVIGVEGVGILAKTDCLKCIS